MGGGGFLIEFESSFGFASGRQPLPQEGNRYFRRTTNTSGGQQIPQADNTYLRWTTHTSGGQ